MLVAIQNWLCVSVQHYLSLPVICITCALIALDKAGLLRAPDCYDFGDCENSQDCDAVDCGDLGD